MARRQPGSGYWGTGTDLKTKRNKPDKAVKYHKKLKDKKEKGKPDEAAEHHKKLKDKKEKDKS